MRLRILYVARYRDQGQIAKVDHMAQADGVTVLLVLPAYWKDAYTGNQDAPVSSSSGGYQTCQVALLGQPTEPHRTVYRTADFGMRRFRPDVLYAEEEPDSLAAAQVCLARRLFAPKARLVLHSWQNQPRKLKPHVKAVMRFTCGQADGVLCANTEAVDLLTCLGYGRRMAVIPGIGVDTGMFHPGTATDADDEFIVGYVGRFVSEKGLDVLLRSVALLIDKLASTGLVGRDSVRVRLVGDGPCKDDLGRLAQDLDIGDLVTFVSPMAPADLAQAFRNLSVLVLPSVTTVHWKEQLGRVLLEAMASRIPVVGSSSGAIPEVIGQAGLVFPEGDAEALCAALERLVVEPGLGDRLGLAGFERVTTDYSQKALAERSLRFFRELCAAKGVD